MSEFSLPATPDDLAWLDLRARLARTANALHVSAACDDPADRAALLVMAGNLANLAISIPMSRAAGLPSGPVEASTLLATQVLQLHRPGHPKALVEEFTD